MRIGIDCRTILNPGLGEQAGIGYYTYCLVRSLLEIDKQNEYVLFFDSRMPDATEFEQANVKIWRFPFSQYKKFLPFSYSHMLIAAMILKNRLTVYHAPANVIPLSYRGTTVLTIHDLAIYQHPEWFPGQLFSTRLLVPRSVKRASHIIAVSEATKRDLLEQFHTAPSKISVVHEAPFVAPINVNDRNVDTVKKFSLRRPYLLYVGTVDPRKNLERLLEAFRQLRKTLATADAQLVIAGGAGYRGERIVEQIEHAKKEGVHYLGYVTHNEKLDLMRQAHAFVFPSLYEGFGLPILEAMQLGVPVITSNVSSLPEVAGEAAMLVDPTNVAELASAMSRMLTDKPLHASLKAKGIVQAQHFSWENAARETLAIYEKAQQRKSIAKPSGKRPKKTKRG